MAAILTMTSKAASKGFQKLFTCRQCKESFTQAQGKGFLFCETCEPGAAATTAVPPQESPPAWVSSLTTVMTDLSSEVQASRKQRENQSQDEPAWVVGVLPAKERNAAVLVPALLQLEASDEDLDSLPDEGEYVQDPDPESRLEDYPEEDSQGVDALIRAVKETLNVSDPEASTAGRQDH